MAPEAFYKQSVTVFCEAREGVVWFFVRLSCGNQVSKCHGNCWSVSRTWGCLRLRTQGKPDSRLMVWFHWKDSTYNVTVGAQSQGQRWHIFSLLSRTISQIYQLTWISGRKTLRIGEPIWTFSFASQSHKKHAIPSFSLNYPNIKTKPSSSWISASLHPTWRWALTKVRQFLFKKDLLTLAWIFLHQSAFYTRLESIHVVMSYPPRVFYFALRFSRLTSHRSIL